MAPAAIVPPLPSARQTRASSRDPSTSIPIPSIPPSASKPRRTTRAGSSTSAQSPAASTSRGSTPLPGPLLTRASSRGVSVGLEAVNGRGARSVSVGKKKATGAKGKGRKARVGASEAESEDEGGLGVRGDDEEEEEDEKPVLPLEEEEEEAAEGTVPPDDALPPVDEDPTPRKRVDPSTRATSHTPTPETLPAPLSPARPPQLSGDSDAAAPSLDQPISPLAPSLPTESSHLSVPPPSPTAPAIPTPNSDALAAASASPRPDKSTGISAIAGLGGYGSSDEDDKEAPVEVDEERDEDEEVRMGLVENASSEVGEAEAKSLDEKEEMEVVEELELEKEREEEVPMDDVQLEEPQVDVEVAALEPQLPTTTASSAPTSIEKLSSTETGPSSPLDEGEEDSTMVASSLAASESAATVVDQDEFSEPPVGEEEGSEKAGAEKGGEEAPAQAVPAEDEEAAALSVEDELELSVVHELEDIAEEPEPDAPSPRTKVSPPALSLDLSDSTVRPRAAQAGSTTALAKRSPPLAGQLAMPPVVTTGMPPGLSGLTQKDVRKKFNGHKVVAVLGLNVELIKLAEEFQAQKPIDMVEYSQLTQRLQANLTYLAAMADQAARPPPPSPILDAPSTPLLGPRLVASYQRIKGYFDAAEKYERQNAITSTTSTPMSATAPTPLPPVARPVVSAAPIPSRASSHAEDVKDEMDSTTTTAVGTPVVEASSSIKASPSGKREREEDGEAVANEVGQDAKKSRTEKIVPMPFPSVVQRVGTPAAPLEAPQPPMPTNSYPTPSPSTNTAPSPFNPPPAFQPPASRSSTPAISAAPSQRPPSQPHAFPTSNPLAAISSHLQPQPSPANQYAQLSPQQQAYMRQQQAAGMAAQQQQTLVAQQHLAAQRHQQEMEQNGQRRTPSLARGESYGTSGAASPRPNANIGIPPPPRPVSALSQQSHGSPASYPGYGEGSQSYQGYPPSQQAQQQQQQPGPSQAQLTADARTIADQYASIQSIITAPTFRALPPSLQNQLQKNAQGLLHQMQAATTAATVMGRMPQGGSPAGQRAPSPRARAPSYSQSPQLGHAQVRQTSGSYAGSYAGSHAGSPPPSVLMQPSSGVESSASYFREQLAQQQQGLLRSQSQSPAIGQPQDPSQAPSMMGYGQQSGNPSYSPSVLSHQRIFSQQQQQQQAQGGQPQSAQYYQQGQPYSQPSHQSPASFSSAPSPAYSNIPPQSPYSTAPTPRALAADSPAGSGSAPSPAPSSSMASKKAPRVTKKAKAAAEAAAEEAGRAAQQAQARQAMQQQQQAQQQQLQAQQRAQLQHQMQQQRAMQQQQQQHGMQPQQQQSQQQQQQNLQQQRQQQFLNNQVQQQALLQKAQQDPRQPHPSQQAFYQQPPTSQPSSQLSYQQPSYPQPPSQSQQQYALQNLHQQAPPPSASPFLAGAAPSTTMASNTSYGGYGGGWAGNGAGAGMSVGTPSAGGAELGSQSGTPGAAPADEVDWNAYLT